MNVYKHAVVFFYEKNEKFFVSLSVQLVLIKFDFEQKVKRIEKNEIDFFLQDYR